MCLSNVSIRSKHSQFRAARPIPPCTTSSWGALGDLALVHTEVQAEHRISVFAQRRNPHLRRTRELRELNRLRHERDLAERPVDALLHGAACLQMTASQKLIKGPHGRRGNPCDA